MAGDECGKSLLNSKFESIGVEELGRGSWLKSTTTVGENPNRT
jgi:hypothetical protein